MVYYVSSAEGVFFIVFLSSNKSHISSGKRALMEEDKTEVNADYSKGLIMKKKKQKNSNKLKRKSSKKTKSGKRKNNGKIKKSKNKKKNRKVNKNNKKKMKKNKKNKERKKMRKVKKRRKIKKRKNKQDSSDECKDVECLNTMVQVLRMNRDAVTNFLKQRKRLVSRISLLSNKASKNNKTNASLSHLEDALGGSTTLKSSSPICGGRYNSTSATQVNLLFLKI